MASLDCSLVDSCSCASRTVSTLETSSAGQLTVMLRQLVVFMTVRVRGCLSKSGVLRVPHKPWAGKETEWLSRLRVGPRTVMHVKLLDRYDSVRAHSDLTVLLYDCRVNFAFPCTLQRSFNRTFIP